VPRLANSARSDKRWASPTAPFERLIGERFDSPCRRFRVFRALRFQADLLELNAKPYPRGVRELLDQTEASARVRVRFGVGEDLQAPVSGIHTGPCRHGCVTANGCMMRELEGNRSVWVWAPIEKSRNAKVHQLSTGLGDFRVHDLVHEGVVEGVHAGRRPSSLKQRMALELAQCVHERIETERHQFGEASDVERRPEDCAPSEHIACFRGEPRNPIPNQFSERVRHRFAGGRCGLCELSCKQCVATAQHKHLGGIRGALNPLNEFCNVLFCEWQQQMLVDQPVASKAPEHAHCSLVVDQLPVACAEHDRYGTRGAHSRHVVKELDRRVVTPMDVVEKQ
jgi:hypothetical protein